MSSVVVKIYLTFNLDRLLCPRQHIDNSQTILMLFRTDSSYQYRINPLQREDEQLVSIYNSEIGIKISSWSVLIKASTDYETRSIVIYIIIIVFGRYNLSTIFPIAFITSRAVAYVLAHLISDSATKMPAVTFTINIAFEIAVSCSWFSA